MKIALIKPDTKGEVRSNTVEAQECQRPYRPSPGGEIFFLVKVGKEDSEKKDFKATFISSKSKVCGVNWKKGERGVIYSLIGYEIHGGGGG